jgi:hypothetical protein
MWYLLPGCQSKSSISLLLYSMEKFLNWDRWGLFNENNHYNFKLFIADEIIGVKRNFLYTKGDQLNFTPKTELISKLNISKSQHDSDFILVPHHWIDIRKNENYKKYLVSLSKRTPLLLENSGDISPKCDLPNTLQLRSFLHPKESDQKKIILPYPAKHQKFDLRDWRPIPQISFVGFVPKMSLGSLTSKSHSFVHSPLKSSVYLNRKLAVKKLKKLKNEFKIVCTERATFTLLPGNPNLNMHIKEYQENLSQSDYILCPRGFGNVSIRFYETLSSGATPLLIDSGTKLPELIDSNFWQSNILVLKLFSDWAKIIWKDWEHLGKSDNYMNRQLRNEKVFSSELYLQKYAEKIFSDYILS